MSDASPDPDMTAAEAALGLLEGRERIEADRRRLADPVFARDVEAWSLRLGRIAEDEASPQPPPPRVWDEVRRRLDAEAGGAAIVRLRLRLRVWRGIAGLAGATAAALAAVLVLRPGPSPTVSAPTAPHAVQTASLAATAGGRVAFVAVLDSARGELVLTPVETAERPGKSPELWAIPTGGKPVSLGVVRFGEPVRLAVRDLVGGDAQRTLAVSIEPEGGSPTGQPTGPVVAAGRLRSL